MLDSLVRVSRRVGWVTDLLAASLRPPTGPPSPTATTVRPPTPRECGGTAAFACDGPSRLPRGGGERAPKGLVIPRSSDEPLADRLTTGDAHEARHRPPSDRPPLRPSRLRCPTGCGVLREGDKCVWRNGSSRSDGPGLGKPYLVFRPARPQLQTESSLHRISRAHPFTSEQFHVLLNSLFKVLCNFPSRYLFAIGLTAVFSLRWSLPPD